MYPRESVKSTRQSKWKRSNPNNVKPANLLDYPPGTEVTKKRRKTEEQLILELLQKAIW
jgi:hypothetical protein